MANAADQVTLSSGQILFADPTSSWVPADFPDLPPTSLAFAVNGTIAGRDIAQLRFSNNITYQNYEVGPIRSTLVKSFVVDAIGNVAYDDPKVSLVSTTLSAYNVGINGFGSPAIGAAGISNSPPDTLTNAIAKLDGWITENMLKQPPPVSLAQIENTSLYAGVRWTNFNVYNVFQYSVPYTTGIVLILGDPATSNFLTLELTNNNWFPDRQYVDGLASDFNPIVRLRVFNEFFPTNMSELYSKAALPSACIKVIAEGGIYTLPATGKVLGIENSVAGESYTTVNLYLPQLPVSEEIPVRISYINKTQTTPNILLAYTSTTTYGAPSPPQNIQQFVSTPTSFTLRVTPPIYSDATNLVSSCFFSSYNVRYTATRMNTAHQANLGFRYGQVTPASLASYLSSFTGSTFTRELPMECGPFQDITITGSGTTTVPPGLQWSTSIYATNLANLIGSTLAAPSTSVSAFPSSLTQNISSASISFTSPWAAPIGSLATLNYANGWNISDPLSSNVLFLASTQVTNYSVNGPVRFNDPSYPGCRSNFTFTSLFKDTDGVVQTNTLTLAPVANDFTLNTSAGVMRNRGHLSTILSDPFTDVRFQKFIYNASITGAQAISTVSNTEQSLTVALRNFAITGFNDPILTRTMSTQHYAFITESASTFNTSTLAFASSVTNTVAISGIYTPTTDSQFLFDLYTSNFVANYANISSFATAQLFFSNVPAGPFTNINSSIFVFNGATEITSLPFPANVPLTLSSCGVPLTSNLYMDPSDPQGVSIGAAVTPGNPDSVRPATVYDIGSTLFIDTVSVPLFSTFTNINTSNGQRVLSLLPRYESPGTADNMNDGISALGLASNGIDVSVSSFFIMNYSNNLTVSSSVIYNNTSTLQSVYTDPYSRELIFTNGHFMHPGGLNFGQFSGIPLGLPSASYPDFSADLSSDENYGNRYASFVYNGRSNTQPTSYQFVNIRVRNPSALSTITNSRDYNYAFPDSPIPNSNVQYSKVRMHMKILGAYNVGTYVPLETAWINCFKEISYGEFEDSIYDVGGCVAVSTSGADIWYKVQMDRRYFTSVYPLVRVGISRDGSAETLPPGSEYLPITFDGLNITVTDF